MADEVGCELVLVWKQVGSGSFSMVAIGHGCNLDRPTSSWVINFTDSTTHGWTLGRNGPVFQLTTLDSKQVEIGSHADSPVGRHRF